MSLVVREPWRFGAVGTDQRFGDRLRYAWWDWRARKGKGPGRIVPQIIEDDPEYQRLRREMGYSDER